MPVAGAVERSNSEIHVANGCVNRPAPDDVSCGSDFPRREALRTLPELWKMLRDGPRGVAIGPARTGWRGGEATDEGRGLGKTHF